jgi:hypothetical protein
MYKFRKGQIKYNLRSKKKIWMTYTQLHQDHKHHKNQVNLVTAGRKFCLCVCVCVCVCACVHARVSKVNFPKS